MATLPVPGGDTDVWGDELNTWLTTGHNADGTHPVPAVIGPTFLTAADVTLTNANTFYTIVTLASALVAGGSYDLSAMALFQDSGVAGDTCMIEIRDTTNNVTIASAEKTILTTLNKTGTIVIPAITYSGYAGTPTIILRAESSGAGDKILKTGTGFGAATNKATMVKALRNG